MTEWCGSRHLSGCSGDRRRTGDRAQPTSLGRSKCREPKTSMLGYVHARGQTLTGYGLLSSRQSGTRNIDVRFDSKANGTGVLRQFASKATRLSSRVAFCYLRLVPCGLRPMLSNDANTQRQAQSARVAHARIARCIPRRAAPRQSRWPTALLRRGTQGQSRPCGRPRAAFTCDESYDVSYQ